MTRISTLAVVVLLAGVSAASADTSQLAASVGAAPGTSLDALAAMKFNRDTGRDEQQSVGATGSGTSIAARALGSASGMGAAPAMTLDEAAAAHINDSTRRDDRQTIVVDPSPNTASLGAAHLAKINAESRRDERQGAY